MNINFSSFSKNDLAQSFTHRHQLADALSLLILVNAFRNLLQLRQFLN